MNAISQSIIDDDLVQIEMSHHSKTAEENNIGLDLKDKFIETTHTPDVTRNEAI